jgi:hypothetical protein
MKVKYIGRHQPQTEREVEAEQGQELINSGDYMLIEDATGTIDEIVTKDTTKKKKSSKHQKNENKE